jgi:hypothetical protein
MDFVSKPRMDHGHIQHYVTTGDESKLNTLKWVIEEIVDSFPNFEKRNKKYKGKSKTVYYIEKPDSKVSEGSIWDAAFEVTDISDSEVTVVFQSGGGNGKQYPDYAKGYDSMISNIMNLRLDIVKMETLFEKAFHEIDLPTNEMGIPSIPDMSSWRKLTKEKFPKRKGGLYSIRLTFRHNFKIKDQDYLGRIISGHPVWIKYE